MMRNTDSPTVETFDGRELPCEIKRPAFIARCIALPLHHSFIFVNGHDPIPLRRHLDQLYPACFRWEPTGSATSEAMHLRVTKIAEPAGGFAAEAADFSCS